MKKILILFLMLFSVGGLIQQAKAESPTTDIYIHYYRFGGDYTGWGIWTWQYEPEGLEGFMTSFSEDTTSDDYNFGGVVAVVNIEDNFPDITTMGLIVNLNSWQEKDIDTDRYIEIPETTENGDYHIYLVEGDTSIGTSLDDPNGPVKNPKFKTAYFTELNTITFTTTEEVNSADVVVYEDDVAMAIDTVSIDGTTGTVIIEGELNFSKQYRIETVFPSDGSTNDYLVTFDGIYDSDEFELAFGYDGDLGAVIDGNTTTFTVWAPVSEAVTLNLYDTGTPANDGGTDTPTDTIVMTSGEKGTFTYTANENLHGTYYTYSVTNGGVTNEVVDPYAKSVGINGERGLVVDFSQVNPEGFEYNSRPDTMDDYTDAIIYELHVRDLTMSDTWNGTEENRGKYLGLIESGTTYEGVSTGFDHLVDLGVTHIQILPFFDYGVVDETKVEDEDYNAFNWGYMPLNFNALEGTYSADPYDGLSRIEEMKEVIMAFSEEDIRINMDVVYNHTGLSADSNFSLIVPGYYYRMTDSGAFSNGSGTGNETASERYMMSRFIVDSTVFWATEYNISGFRFDLMALHDTDTMSAVVDALHDIDPTIMVYGEPWMGGSTTLDESLQSGKDNLYLLDGVAAFNDDFRDGAKGSVFSSIQKGWIQGDFTSSFVNRVKYGVTGGVELPYFSYNAWHTEPVKTINYVTAHDNNTLYDKLYLSLEEDGDLDLIPAMVKQAYGLVYTSQGIAFMHAGDEFLRSKPDESGTGFDHNSYESPDSVNQIDWSLKVSEDGAEVYDYVKNLIELRKNHESFTMATSEAVQANLSFVYEDVEGVIAYTITNDASGDIYENIMVINNANDKTVKLTLPEDGAWVLITDGQTAGDTELDVYKGNSSIKVEAHSTYILFKGVNLDYDGDLDVDPLSINAYTDLADYNPVPTIIISIVGGLTVVAAGVFVFLRFKK